MATVVSPCTCTLRDQCGLFWPSSTRKSPICPQNTTRPIGFGLAICMLQMIWCISRAPSRVQLFLIGRTNCGDASAPPFNATLPLGGVQPAPRSIKLLALFNTNFHARGNSGLNGRRIEASRGCWTKLRLFAETRNETSAPAPFGSLLLFSPSSPQ